MKQRVTNPNVPNADSYGGRGIDMDPRWEDFQTFLSDMGERPAGMTLDRIDNDRGYWKDNCRWATKAEQMSNTRRSVLLTFEGRTQNAKAWATERGLNYNTVLGRYRAGWPIEKVLSKEKFYENQFTNPRRKEDVRPHYKYRSKHEEDPADNPRPA